MTDVRWDREFDHFHPAYADDPFPIWDELRDTCPVARSERFRGMVVPTRHADIEVVARDPDTYSSRSPLVASFGAMADYGIVAPPISSDPPYHTAFRKLLLPFFSPRRIEALRPAVEAHCDRLINKALPTGAGALDAAVDYAQHIPVRVIALLLGVPPADGDRFRTWVHELLELGPNDIDAAAEGLTSFRAYFQAQIDQRRQATEPGDDLISFLLAAELDGRPLDEDEVFGGCLLLLLAGIDTTWSAIGASLWHLARHPEDQQRLRAEPELMPTAIEELLRAYAPVTMAREVVADADLGGCPVQAGTPLLLPFPAANRDPAVFDDADTVILDRQRNRHVAFGIGIHRCLGSNLARMEVTVAVERFLASVGSFRLAEPGGVRWSTGQVRGPRTLPLAIG
ncbi:cytochrome P450 [soil metagenome]